jgi:hypothetical protein
MKDRDAIGCGVLWNGEEVQKAIDKLADYEDAEEWNKSQFVTKAQRDFIDAVVDCILVADSQKEIANYGMELAGAWLMLTTGWYSKV